MADKPENHTKLKFHFNTPEGTAKPSEETPAVEEQTKPAPRPRRPRARKKEMTPEAAVVGPVEVAAPVVATPAPAPIAAVTVTPPTENKAPALDAVTSQWQQLEKLSAAVSQNLEKVTQALGHQVGQIEKLSVHTVAKPSSVAKWAMAAAVGAIVLSSVSLILAQAARQELLTLNEPAPPPVVASRPVAAPAPVVQPKAPVAAATPRPAAPLMAVPAVAPKPVASAPAPRPTSLNPLQFFRATRAEVAAKNQKRDVKHH